MKEKLQKALIKACVSKLSDKTSIVKMQEIPFMGFSYFRIDWFDQDEGIETVTLNTALSHLNTPANWTKTETYVMMPEWGTQPLSRSWIIRLPTHYEGKEMYLFHYYYQATHSDKKEVVSDTFTNMIVPKEIEYIDHSGECTHVILHWSLKGWSYPQDTELEAKGISAEVINIHTIKPLDEDVILKSVAKTGCVVTCEEHNYYGGLGESVSRVLSTNSPAPQEFVAVNDTFGESGRPEELMKKYGLDKEGILKAVEKVLKRK